jgi:hypothetical protein
MAGAHRQNLCTGSGLSSRVGDCASSGLAVCAPSVKGVVRLDGQGFRTEMGFLLNIFIVIIILSAQQFSGKS